MDASQDVAGAQEVHALEAVILAFRGDREQAVERVALLEAASRQSGDPGSILTFLCSAAIVRAALGDSAAARDLLIDVDRNPGARASLEYPYVLPSMIRAALSFGDSGLAGRLVAGVESRNQLAEHALVTAGAAITEARGDLAPAVATYAAAADRWRRFGVVPEEAFALLGQGRCLLALGRTAEAVAVLRQARGIFERLGARPALADTDALLATLS